MKAGNRTGGDLTIGKQTYNLEGQNFCSATRISSKGFCNNPFTSKVTVTCEPVTTFDCISSTNMKIWYAPQSGDL